jgi:hypothetical protein
MAPPSLSLFAGKIGKRASRGANAMYLFLGGSSALSRIGHEKWPGRYSARLGGSAMMPLLSMTYSRQVQSMDRQQSVKLVGFLLVRPTANINHDRQPTARAVGVRN